MSGNESPSLDGLDAMMEAFAPRRRKDKNKAPPEKAIAPVVVKKNEVNEAPLASAGESTDIADAQVHIPEKETDPSPSLDDHDGAPDGEGISTILQPSAYGPKAIKSAEVSVHAWKQPEGMSKRDYDIVCKTAVRIKIQHRLNGFIVVTIGKALNTLRENFNRKYRHGEFFRFIEEAIQMSRATAYRYMGAANVFSDPERLRYLSVNTIYKLANPKIPESVREQATAAKSEVEAIGYLKEYTKAQKAGEANGHPDHATTTEHSADGPDPLTGHIDLIKELLAFNTKAQELKARLAQTSGKESLALVRLFNGIEKNVLKLQAQGGDGEPSTRKDEG